MCEIKYEEKLCVFIDILGWKEATNTLSAGALFKILQPFVEVGDEHQFHKGFIEDAKKNQKEISGNWIRTLIKGRKASIPTHYEQVQLTIFSDTLVLSKPAAWVGRIYSNLPFIIRGFLEKGFIIRGGISLGRLYHKDNIIFGPALIEAYEIEHHRAIFPRIIISDEVIEKTGTDSYLPIMKDQLGNWVIDPFPKVCGIAYNDNEWRQYLSINFKTKDIVKIIEQSIINISDDIKLRDKWIFQAEVCAMSLEKYGDAARDLILKLRNFLK